MKIFPEGFTIGAVAPAGKVAEETVSAGVAVLRSLGAKVKLYPHILQGHRTLPYLAADDTDRAADLESAWLDPEIDMIWAIRGGYGCARFLEMVNWEKLAQRNIPVAGFSDITSLHWAMTAKNCGTVMALPMFSFLKDPNEATLKSLDRIFKKEEQTFTLPALRSGEISGLPLPGNLTVATSLCGTPYFPDTTGRILVLEEVREAPYRIDRMLNQLLMCRAFRKCAGAVFGYFTACGSDPEIMKVLEDFTGKVDVPVFYGLKFGHEQPFIPIRSDQIMRVKE